MRSFRYLIGADGEVAAWPYLAMRRELNCAAETSTFADFAVTNLGFIGLINSSHGLAVTFRSEIVSTLALISAIGFLFDQPKQRAIVTTLSNGGEDCRLFHDPDEVVSKLIAEMQLREAKHANFLHQPQRIDAVGEHGRLADLFRVWANARGVFDDAGVDALGRHLLRGRFALVEPVHDGRTLLIRDWGNAYGSFDDRWLGMARGLRFEDQPDFRYAREAVRAYHEVLRLGAPLLDDVDAIISTARDGPTRIQYRRMILPIQVPTRGLQLLSTSLVDPEIDLRTPRRRKV